MWAPGFFYAPFFFIPVFDACNSFLNDFLLEFQKDVIIKQ